MKLVKLYIFGLITVIAINVNASPFSKVSNNGTNASTQYNQDDDEDKPSIQTDNFKRKGKIGYESVNQKADPENTIGDKGTVTDDWSERKGKIGYDAVITPDEKISPEREISDKRTIEKNWSDRKGKIGYDAIIDQEEK